MSALGLVGWIIGAICVIAMFYQRDKNRELEKQEESARKEKAASKVS